MIIDDHIFIKFIAPLIRVGLSTAENTKHFYDILNDYQTSEFISSNKLGTDQFYFLRSVLENQELTKCPYCGHYNDNIECPIIRCEICDHQWKIDTKYSDLLCETCIAYRTNKCDKNPKTGENNGNDES